MKIKANQNKELFENAPPYMIMMPSLKEGHYMNITTNLYLMHFHLFTNPYEYGG